MASPTPGGTLVSVEPLTTNVGAVMRVVSAPVACAMSRMTFNAHRAVPGSWVYRVASIAARSSHLVVQPVFGLATLRRRRRPSQGALMAVSRKRMPQA